MSFPASRPYSFPAFIVHFVLSWLILLIESGDPIHFPAHKIGMPERKQPAADNAD